jgi:hypothetical protein
MARQRARTAVSRQKHEQEFEGTMKAKDVAADQLKYYNLLRAMQMGVTVQSSNYVDASSMETKKNRKIEAVLKYIYIFMFRRILRMFFLESSQRTQIVSS